MSLFAHQSVCLSTHPSRRDTTNVHDIKNLHRRGQVQKWSGGSRGCAEFQNIKEVNPLATPAPHPALIILIMTQVYGPSVHSSIHPSIHLSTHPLVHPFTEPPIHPSTHPPSPGEVHPFTQQSIHPSTRSTVHLLVHPSVHLAVRKRAGVLCEKDWNHPWRTCASASEV